jgi:UDP-glucose 4-epimerase
MRIAVTGASGRLGSATVTALLEHGHEVVAIDNRPTSHRDVRSMQADLRDLGQTYGALAGAEAIIHLAAIPAPRGWPPEVVYATNVLSTFNVFEAAATLGIRRVVSASSVSALGFPWQHRWSEPLYLPIDEAHPLLPQDCYGLSKVQGEETAAAYCRRGAGSAASLRFSTILSQDALAQYVAGVHAEPQRHAHLLWSYVDLAVAADACVRAVDAAFEGHEPLYITADDTTSDLPTDTLLDRYFPNVPRRPGDRPARWSLLDVSRARQVIGYQPRL